LDPFLDGTKLLIGSKNDLYLDKIKTGNVWDWFKKLGKLK